jgi:hypothetical protein
MPGWRTRRFARALVLGTIGLLGCGQRDPSLANVVGDEPATASEHVLKSGWTPQDLGPAAWYVASRDDFVFRKNDGKFAWLDRTGNHDATSGTVPEGSPKLVEDGWFGAATLHFDGGDLLSVPAWSDAPSGRAADFSILAVMRAGAVQDASIAGFWDPNGGFVWAELKASNGLTLPDLTRTFGLASGQMYTAPHDLGTAPHVIAWRYLSSTETIEVTVDGTTSASTSLGPIGELPAMPFIIGAKSLLPTGTFTGDLSELVVVGRAISEAEVRDFTDYARLTWPLLPARGSADPCTRADGAASPDFTRCDDGNAETYGDRCAAGACIGDVPRAGSPAELSTVAWYHAGAAEVAVTGGRVSTWFDRTANHLDLSQAFDAGRPKLDDRGWDGVNKPALAFGGHDLLRRGHAAGLPDTGASDFTVFGVVRADGGENAGLASWASGDGYRRATIRLGNNAGPTLLARLGTDAVAPNADFLDGLRPDLGTSRHVVIWQYSPANTKVTVDGRTTSVTNPAPLGNFKPTAAIVGGASDFGPAYFKGNLAELALISGPLSELEVAKLSRYARDEWGGITLCESDCTLASAP